MYNGNIIFPSQMVNQIDKYLATLLAKNNTIVRQEYTVH